MIYITSQVQISKLRIKFIAKIFFMIGGTFQMTTVTVMEIPDQNITIPTDVLPVYFYHQSRN